VRWKADKRRMPTVPTSSRGDLIPTIHSAEKCEALFFRVTDVVADEVGTPHLEKAVVEDCAERVQHFAEYACQRGLTNTSGHKRTPRGARGGAASRYEAFFFFFATGGKKNRVHDRNVPFSRFLPPVAKT